MCKNIILTTNIIDFSLNPCRTSQRDAINAIKANHLFSRSSYLATILVSLRSLGPSLQEFKATFQQADFRVIYHSAFILTQGTWTVSDVWLLCKPLTPDCLGGHGDRESRSRGMGRGMGVGSIWRVEGLPVWECRTQTVPDVYLRGDGVVCEPL